MRTPHRLARLDIAGEVGKEGGRKRKGKGQKSAEFVQDDDDEELDEDAEDAERSGGENGDENDGA